MTSSSVDHNSAEMYGGGVSANRLNIINSTIRENSALGGGGIKLSAPGYVEAVGSSIEGISSAVANGADSPSLGSATIVGSIISGNSARRSGGGVTADVALTIMNSIITGNEASTHGGGVAVGDALIMRNSIVSGNAAGDANGSSANGGGIYLPGTGAAAIDSSTISGNFAAGLGGGIGTRANTRTIEILNSTVSGNTSRSGGGISGGRLTIRHSTVTDNSSIFVRGDLGAFGGINATNVTLDHSIVAGNDEMASVAPDISGAITSHYSLVGNKKGTQLVEAPVGSPDANGNLIGGPMHGVIDPKLGPLVMNGGPTPTHALLDGSPAINAGDLNAKAGLNGVPQFEQRGEPFRRIAGGRIDMGAIEAQPNPLPGDYNFNGVVDAADFGVWRVTNGEASDLRADGNGDGNVNNVDYQVWRANFGTTRPLDEAMVVAISVDANSSSPADSFQVARSGRLQIATVPVGTARGRRRLVASAAISNSQMPAHERFATLVAAHRAGGFQDVRADAIRASDTSRDAAEVQADEWTTMDAAFASLFER